MPYAIGPIVENLMSRVRQIGGIAVEPDFATKVLTISQQIVNLSLKRIVNSTSLTTKKSKLIYSFPGDLPNAGEIVNISEGTRQLFQFKKLSDLAAHDSTWFRNITGTRFEAWTSIGQSMFVVYPAKASGSAVTVEYVKKTTVVDNFQQYYNTSLDLPEEDTEKILRLAEVLLLLRGRKVAVLQGIFKEVQDTLRSQANDSK